MNNSDLISKNSDTADIISEKELFRPSKYSNKSISAIIMRYASMFLFLISALTFIIVNSTGFIILAESVADLPNTFYGITMKALYAFLNAMPFISGISGIVCVLVILIPQLICNDTAFIISLAAWSCVLGMIWWLMIERIPLITMHLAFIACLIFNLQLIYSICDRTRNLSSENKKIAGETALVYLVPFYNIYWSYIKGKEIVKNAKLCGVSISDRSVVYLILNIFGLGLISYFLMTSQLNRINKTLAPGR